MNEPSNFCDGACTNSSNNASHVSLDFDPVSPPYVIGNRRASGDNEAAPLKQKTLDMDAKHHSGILAYNMHNLYGEMGALSSDMQAMLYDVELAIGSVWMV